MFIIRQKLRLKALSMVHLNNQPEIQPLSQQGLALASSENTVFCSQLSNFDALGGPYRNVPTKFLGSVKFG
jgi:hypothetical protein